ncbi:Rab3 GTPase-activating protein non-catalytic subunit [Podila minutissima]|nr:Rab3 GTPase-activating protein non-catalytic subunit [Podila minutissima]
MSHHRWELSPLGAIPNEVLSILLGSLPKVPDPRQEVEALKRQLSSHDDRLSEDEEDDDSRQGDGLIHEAISASDDANAYLEQLDSDRNDGTSSPGEESQRSWNVPDDEWQWSDGDGSSNNTPSSSTSRVSNRPAATGNSKRESSLKVPSRTTQKPTGLGLLNSSPQGSSKGNLPTFAPGVPLSSGTTSSATTGASDSHRHSHHHPSRTSAQSTHSHPLSVAQDLSISICDSGRYLACASKKMFAILQHCPNQHSPTTLSSTDGGGSSGTSNEWVLVGQGSGVDNALDAITAVLCLPLYAPRSHQSQIYVVVGYKSGMIRIFNETGQLVVIQQLHHTPVMSIKARIGTGKVPGEDEDEMTILHEGGKVVCIEGESLWVVLRLSNGANRLSIDGKGSAAPTFAYKKWSLLNQDLLVDVVSCGPARHKPTLSNGFSSSSSSSMYTSQATERFMTVGSKPMIAFYASSSSSRPLFSATSLATQMAAKVTNAVFGFAKSIWGSTSPRPGSPALGSSSGRTSPDQKRLSGQGGVQEGMYGSIYSSAMAPATEVPAVLWLSDSQRCIRHVSLAPLPPRGSCHHHPSKLAAMTDSLGRVLLVDLEECEIIRMWKGLRGARCGWIQKERLIKTSRGQGSNTDAAPATKRRLVLYLVIYAPKRGTVEVYPARQGKRVGLLQVGLGWKVCTTFTSPIGKPVVLDRVTGVPRPGETSSFSPVTSNPGSPRVGSSGSVTPLGLAQCLMIGPRGEVRRVGSVPADSSAMSSPGSQPNVGSDATNSLFVSPELPPSTVSVTEHIQSQ